MEERQSSGWERGTITDMRLRRFVGILERALLGAAMSAVLSIAERRLSRKRIGAVRGILRAAGRESVKTSTPDGADGL